MISNASPIIFLSKAGQLFLLKKLFGSIVISKDIKHEVLIQGRPETVYIANAIKEGWIKAVIVKKDPAIGIKGGESSAITLAIKRKDKLIIDDAVAIKVAKAFGIGVIRTTTIIFMAAERKIITKEQAISLINTLIDNGYYISPKYYSAILSKLNA